MSNQLREALGVIESDGYGTRPPNSDITELAQHYRERIQWCRAVARAALSAQVPEDDAGLVERLRREAAALRRANLPTLSMAISLLEEAAGWIIIQDATAAEAADRIEVLSRQTKVADV